MKIFLPFKVKDIGGTSTFARKFQAGLANLGHEVFFEFREDYDALFLIVQGPFSYARHAKRHKRPIIQRLDGVYYWSVAGWRFPLLNAKAALTRHLFTDVTVYQSDYSRASVNRFLGRRLGEQAATIYNGVDLSIFSPEGEQIDLRDNPDQVIFFTASDFRREDQIKPLLEGVSRYREQYNENVRLVLAGSFRGEVAELPKLLEAIPHITLLGKVQNADLPKYARGADVFLFSHLNPPCPNNIIEAMACGLPICGVADGAMPELVTSGENGLLIPAAGSGHWRKRELALSAFVANLHEVVTHREAWGQASRRIAEARFSLREMAERYADVIQGANK